MIVRFRLLGKRGDMCDCQIDRLSGVFIDGTIRLGVLVGFHNKILRLESHFVEPRKEIRNRSIALRFDLRDNFRHCVFDLPRTSRSVVQSLQFRGRALIFP